MHSDMATQQQDGVESGGDPRFYAGFDLPLSWGHFARKKAFYDPVSTQHDCLSADLSKSVEIDGNSLKG